MGAMADEGGPRSLSCERCGASVPPAGGRFVACPYCGQLYDLSDTDSPRRGELLLAADFRDPGLPGWRVYQKERLRVGEGGLPRLVGGFPKKENTSWLFESDGSFDNIDAAVTITFLDVQDVTKPCRLGFDFRSTDEGHYCVDISPKGNYCVARYESASEEKWRILVRFASHPALRPGVGVANRLRVVAYNDHLRVHVNDVLVSSVRDSRFTYGTVGVVLENTGTDVTFALSDLELREAVEQT
jgi:hypothetical protein